MPLPADLDGQLHLIVVLVDVIDQAGVAPVPDQALELLHDGGKQHILGALDDHGDDRVRLLAQMLGVAVQMKIVGLHHRFHPPSGILRHIGTAVEHPGDGAHRVPGHPGNILDGHLFCLFPGLCPALRLVHGTPAFLYARHSILTAVSHHCKDFPVQPFTAPAATPLMMYFWQAR